MIIGYARVSTDEQKLDLQIQALESAGCDTIFTDQGESGGHFSRSGLDAATSALTEGGTLVVWRLDRLGRSLFGLVQIMETLSDRGIHFRSLTEHIDTASSGGRLMFHMMAALAEFERSLIAERTRAGLTAARIRGKTLGRPRLLSEKDIRNASFRLNNGSETLRDIAYSFKVSSRTLSRYLKNTKYHNVDVRSGGF
ncbi:recombinase family protein [Gluconobacter japonicus]|uniref:recombinase family protein n=1 Tax=Gluconobacter japonicus TaxID=376620 RepID=UPI0024AD6913|nr:recombinase family protein [Gluconobacter japonicus]MDI6653499.1 recombinase family protein [Gluconobacter japonicus]